MGRCFHEEIAHSILKITTNNGSTIRWKAKMVYDRMVGGKSEVSRSVIASLRFRGDGSDFDVRKAEVEESVNTFALFIKTGSNSHWIRELSSP